MNKKVDGALVSLLGDLFKAPELNQLLEREDWAFKWLGNIPAPDRVPPNTWFHNLVCAIDQHNLRPHLRELLLHVRPLRQADIDAVLSARPPAPTIPEHVPAAPPVPAPPIPPRPHLLRAGLALTAAITALVALATAAPPDLSTGSPTPVPQGDLRLTVVYLDPPQAGGSRAADWAQALQAVLAAGPRAALLHGRRRPSEDNTALRELLRAHPDLPVLGLLPLPEGGEPVAELEPLVPACAAGAREGCVRVNLPTPAEEALERISPCRAAQPTLAVALARLAQSPTALDRPIEEDCRVDEQVEALSIPTAPCRLPYRWLWVTELTSGALGPPRVPKRPRGEEVCAGWLELADRVVVLDDPWADDAERRVPMDRGEPLPVPRAEALAAATWTTLGVLEDR